MEKEEKQNEIIEMLAKNEEKVSELYEAYALKFPDYQEFWCGLASEELGHAAWIRKLSDNEEVVFNNRKSIKSDLVEVSLKYLGDKIHEAKTQEMTIADALSVAIELETNLIERDFFTVFEGDSWLVKDTFQSLATATQGHVEKVRDLWVKKVKK